MVKKQGKLKNLINDIFWVLNKENRHPSNDFIWFEDAHSV